MADRIVIEAEPRDVTGKRVNQLRRDGWIPGVIYGQQSSESVQMEQKALRRALRTVGTTHLADLRVGANVRTVLVREIQQHATRGDVLHVDFMVVDMTAKLRATAELVKVGESAPAKDGLGVATLVMREVDIECLPEDLISEIEVDVSAIETPDVVITVADLQVPQGVTILTDPELTVARFEYVQAEEVEEEEEVEEFFEEEGEEPEVIAKGKKEEEEF